MVNIVARVVEALDLLSLPFSVRAAYCFRDGTNTGGAGKGASAGDTAVWDTSILTLGHANALNRVACVDGNNVTAIFSVTAGRVSPDTNATIGGLQFNKAACTIKGNTLTFGATTTRAGTLQTGSVGALISTSSLVMTNGSVTVELNWPTAQFTGSTLSGTTALIVDQAAGPGTTTGHLGTVTANVVGQIKDGPTWNVALTLADNNNPPTFSNGSNTFSAGVTLFHTGSDGAQSLTTVDNGKLTLPGVNTCPGDWFCMILGPFFSCRRLHAVVGDQDAILPLKLILQRSQVR
jgi:hypothetical protein